MMTCFRFGIKRGLPRAVANISFAAPQCYVSSMFPDASKENIIKLFLEQLSFNDAQIQELEKVTHRSRFYVWSKELVV